MNLLGYFRSKLKEVPGKDREFRQQLMRQQPASVWCLDNLKLESDGLVLDGWALTPRRAKPALTVNGVKLASSFGRPRPDLERLMWFDMRAPVAGFHAEHMGIAEFLAGDDALEIQFCDEVTLHPFNAGHAFYWPLNPPNHEFPNPARRRRVHGDTNAAAFIINGYSTFKKLSFALTTLSWEWKSFSRILDWGCGCGRVLRYLPQEVLSRLVGADIDADNVDWCRRNFSAAQFHAVPLLPPTPFANTSFDLLFGVSVFTHLREQPQHAWLQELSRITSSGGLVLMTIHGPTAVARADLSRDQYHEWMTKGFLVVGPNVDLNGAISDDTYYVNSLHTHDYIQREWGKYFEILKICDSYIANHQDLVVMRKR